MRNIFKYSWLIILLPLALLPAYLFAAGDAKAPFAAPKPETRRNAKDGAVMIRIPAGDFLMGTSMEDLDQLLKAHPKWKKDWFADELPQHTVHLDDYWIYQSDVTVKQYRAFCQATGREMPELPKWEKDDHPIVNVTWFDAVAYAEWVGGRLPSEAEWEKAARGTTGNRYPWGNEWDGDKCLNYNDANPTEAAHPAGKTKPVGSYPTGDSPYGLHDMAGNVWQWCNDWYAKDYYAHAPSANPKGAEEGELRVMRGGSWGSSNISVRCAARHADSPDVTYHLAGGFRCALSATPRGK